MKSVQIVAGDHAAAGRKMKRQVSVAVVEYVEQIKVCCSLSQQNGVLNGSIPKPIEVPGKARGLQETKGGSASSKRGTYTFNIKGVSRRALQFSPEHVRDQVHARPAFFSKIADQAYTKHHSVAPRQFDC